MLMRRNNAEFSQKQNNARKTATRDAFVTGADDIFSFIYSQHH